MVVIEQPGNQNRTNIIMNTYHIQTAAILVRQDLYNVDTNTQSGVQKKKKTKKCFNYTDLHLFK